MYHVKKIVMFNGIEGEGYNCNLYRDKTKIAEVINDASGGDVNFYWTDQGSPRVETNGIDPYKDEPRVFKDTPEESLFRTYCLGLPKWDCNGKMVHRCMDIAIEDLVNDTLSARSLKRALKNIVTFEKDNKVYIYTRKATPENITIFKAKKPDAIILNSLAFEEALQLFTKDMAQ